MLHLALHNSPARVLLALGFLSLFLAGCVGAEARTAAGWPGIAVDETTAYVAYNEAVYAVDLATLRERWRFPDDFPSEETNRNMTFFAAPAVSAEGLLIFGGYDNVVYGRNAATGVPVWRFEEAQGRIIGGAAVAAGLALVPSADHTLYALEAGTGDLVWEFETEQALWAAPLVVDEVVYLPSMDHRVYALDLATGRLIWQSEPLSGALADTPALADQTLVVGTFNNQLVALDARNGGIRWSYDTQDWVWGSPVVAGGVAYFGDLAGKLYAIDLASGAEVWPPEQLGGRITVTPGLTRDRLYVVTDTGEIFARSLEGDAPSWRLTEQGQLLSDPLLVDDILFIASTDPASLLRAYDVNSGAERLSFSPEE